MTTHQPPRLGTIFWGAILLIFAAVVFGVVVFDLRAFQPATVTWIVTGLGGVFVVAAIVALIARAVSGATTDEPEVSADPTTDKPKKGQPID